MENMGSLLALCQLGYGIKSGAKAAVHAAKQYLHSLSTNQVLLKLVFRNAFNSVHRDKMLEAVPVWAPQLFTFVHSAYFSPSSLLWGDRILESAEGVQQGDPLGPLLFCLSVHQLSSQLRSELCLFYLDEVTHEGNLEDVRYDVEVVEREAADLGLQLN